MSCCAHSGDSHPAARGHEPLTRGKGTPLPHCLGCCRDATADLRHWSWGGDDERPLEVRHLHLHAYEPDGAELPGVAMLQLSPAWVRYRDGAVGEEPADA